MYPLVQGLIIGFLGAGLYFAVDYYEPNEGLARFLKISVVMWGTAAVLHCSGLMGDGFF
jgi:hypothetical protein